MSLPLDVPASVRNSITKTIVAERLDGLVKRVHTAVPEGIMGPEDAPPNQRLQVYVMMTEAIQDLPLLMMPDYLERYQAGELPALQSPRWLQAMSVPDTMKELQRDFIRLLSRAAE